MNGLALEKNWFLYLLEAIAPHGCHFSASCSKLTIFRTFSVSSLVFGLFLMKHSADAPSILDSVKWCFAKLKWRCSLKAVASLSTLVKSRALWFTHKVCGHARLWNVIRKSLANEQTLRASLREELYLNLDADTRSELVEWLDSRDFVAFIMIEWKAERQHSGLDRGIQCHLESGFQQQDAVAFIVCAVVLIEEKKGRKTMENNPKKTKWLFFFNLYNQI